MANFEQRASGYWQARIRRKGYADQSKTFRLRVDAEAWARSVESEMDRGGFVSKAEAESTTLFEALIRYETEVSKFKKGYEQERYRISVWKSNPLAKRTLAALRATDFAKYRDARVADGVSASTIRNELALISHLFTVCHKEWGIPVANHVKNIRLPKVINSRERRLEKDEYERILAAFSVADVKGGGARTNIWIRPAFDLAIETAMRQGELLGLMWGNIDLNRRVAHLEDTKNGESRDVPLSSSALTVLQNLPRSLNGKVFATTASALDQSWRRTLSRARSQYEQELKTAGKTDGYVKEDSLLLGLTWHDLRHEATSRLAGKLAMHELMKVTGHKDVRMLARYYHPRAEDLALKLG